MLNVGHGCHELNDESKKAFEDSFRVKKVD
jgi:hypothetical protein